MEEREFEVYGKTILLKTGEDPKYLQALFALIDKKMHELKLQFPGMSTEKLSIITSLFILSDSVGSNREDFMLNQSFTKNDISSIENSTALMLESLDEVLI